MRLDPRPAHGSLLLCLALVLGTSVGGRFRAAAQPAPPAEAIATVVGLLERDGYTARFTWSDRGTAAGEVRYQSDVAFSLFVEEAGAAAVEYVLHDPLISSRTRQSGGEWAGWRRHEWHPDAPIEGLTQFHPRLPLELLRGATDLTDAGIEGPPERPLRRIDGISSFIAAVIAVHGHAPVGREIQDAVAASRWPLSVWLDATDSRLVRLDLEFPGTDDGAAAERVTYTFEQSEGPVTVTPPAEAEEIESPLVVRPAPAEAARPLPFSIRGSGRQITSPPFLVGDAPFRARLSRGVSGLQYQLWTTKRGRQLIAAVGAAVSGPASVSFPVGVAPGEYVLDIQLDEDVEWELTFEEIPPDEEAADASSGVRGPRLSDVQQSLGGLPW